MILSVSSSFKNHSRTSICSVPFTGSPPIPIQDDCPKPTSDVCFTASYVKVPDLDTTPTDPRLWMWPGMMPILQASGVITPGQFGPTRIEVEFSRALFTFNISRTGIPSVIQTINSIRASIASKMESAAKGGGTYITEALAFVLCFASCTELNTGKPKWSLPPLPGVTPPTIFVP